MKGNNTVKNKIYVTKLTNNEIALIQKYASEGFYTQARYNIFGKHRKIIELCKKFRVCSFEEIIRKVLFFNMFDLNLNDNYLSHVQRTSEEYVNISRIIRNQMMDFAKNVTQEFGELCTHCAALTDDELFHIVEPIIDKIKSNQENSLLFNNVDKFIDLIYEKFNFPTIFETLFELDDEFRDAINKAEELLHSKPAKYLMTVRLLMEIAFPIRIERKTTLEENELINFLMYKGDEIDYIKLHNLSPDDFYNKFDEILNVYDVFDIHELLIKTNMERDFTESSIVFNNMLAFIRNCSISKKQDIEKLQESMNDYRDGDFFILSKSKELKSLFSDIFENANYEELVCS